MQEGLNVVRRNIRVPSFSTTGNLSDVPDKSVTNVLPKKLFDGQREPTDGSKRCKSVVTAELLKGSGQSDHRVVMNFLRRQTLISFVVVIVRPSLFCLKL